MMLKQLKEGQRFEFSDKSTLLEIDNPYHVFPASGTFKYEGVAEGTRPLLIHEQSGYRFTPMSATYYRGVVILL